MTPGEGSRPGAEVPDWVRSYSARRGRNSALTAERLATHLPARGIPDGPLDPVAVFGRVAPLVLEVGSGHGAAAIAYALTHPGHDVLAVEVHTPGVARMLAAAHDAGAPNLRAHRGDAVLLLTEAVAPGSLHSVHLFFPDPWPKARHAKRRFVTPHTLDLVADRLRPEGDLLIATDQDFYAEHALEQLAAHGGWDVVVGERPTWRPTDGYEDKGLAAGRAITDLRARSRRRARPGESG